MKKKIWTVILYVILIPFIASFVDTVAQLFTGLDWLPLVIVPIISIILVILFKKKHDMTFLANIYGALLVLLSIVFTILMIVGKGNAESIIVGNFSWFVLPFFPFLLIGSLMRQYLLMYMVVFLTLMACYVTCSILAKRGWSHKGYLIVMGTLVIAVAISTVMYNNRPQKKYAGHGFDYMNGFSSTDFTDYMVYAENSKLVTLDHPAALQIGNEEDMPVLDGAEACYPLYAAFAKACYKNIDKIELEWKEDGPQEFNGKYVSFSNSVRGFMRLLETDEQYIRDYYARVDMLFAARPSADQLWEAQEAGIELDVTPIGREAFVFFVEEDNPVDNLTSEQIKSIYHGDITNWKEVGGKDEKIRAFQRPQNSGSQTMMEYFMGDVTLKETETYETVDSMAGVIRNVAQYNNEAGAFGYTFRYFLEELNQEKGVKMISVDGVYPSLENIKNGSYPLTVNVCLITRTNETNPYVEKMKEFILSEDGQYIIEKTGYATLK